MNNAADPGTGGDIPDAKLADVSEMSFDAILDEESALGGALQRLAWETRSDEDRYVAFSSFAPDSTEPPAVAVRPA